MAMNPRLLRPLARFQTPPEETTPGAPTSVSGTSGDAQVSLTWSAPSSSGGSSITDYAVQYSSNSGSTWTTFSDGTSTATSATVTGLTNGTGYVFRVAATNAVGTGSYSSASASVTPAAALNVAMLLHFDGSNESTSFTDSSPNSLDVTAIGSGEISDAQSKFGGTSLDAQTGGVYVEDPQDTIFSGGGDFTLEFWVYYLGANDLYGRLFQCEDYPAADGWDISIVPSSDPKAIKLEHYTASDLVTGAVLPENQWAHVAVTRESGTIRLFLDGSLIGSYSSAVTLRDGYMTFGSNSAGGENVEAFFDEARLVKGTALYTAAFTPPSSPF